MATKIAIIGECMLELNGEPFGLMHQSYGGDTLNTATYLARLSKASEVEITYITAIGNDPFSRKMCAFWQADGIDTRYVLTDPNRLAGLYVIQLDEHGERTFLNWRHHSAARYLLQHPDYPQVLAHLKTVDFIYLSGISLAILPPQDRLTLLTQLKNLANQNVKIIFDSNYRPVLWESREVAQACYQALLPDIHIALVTEEDEKALWQDDDLAQIVARLQHFQLPHLIVKSGKNGADYFPLNDLPMHISAKPVANVIDTTAAGDAFNAGFIAGYLQHQPIEQCCRQGNQVAGVVIQHQGAIVARDATAHLVSQCN